MISQDGRKASDTVPYTEPYTEPCTEGTRLGHLEGDDLPKDVKHPTDTVDAVDPHLGFELGLELGLG